MQLHLPKISRKLAHKFLSNTALRQPGRPADNSGKQEQQRLAVGPGNAHYMCIRQVSLRRGTCGYCSAAAAATTAAAADVAAIKQFTD